MTPAAPDVSHFSIHRLSEPADTAARYNPNAFRLLPSLFLLLLPIPAFKSIYLCQQSMDNVFVIENIPGIIRRFIIQRLRSDRR